MNVETKEPADQAAMGAKLPMPPKFATVAEERLHRRQRLAAGFRLFSKFGFDEGVAGHITARDPEFPDTFWVNPFGVHFSQIKVSNLIRCDHSGKVVEGDYPLNTAAFVIHSRVHAARPDAVAAAHAHSTYGRAFSTLGRPLAPITQDVCAFYNDHAGQSGDESATHTLPRSCNDGPLRSDPALWPQVAAWGFAEAI
jgi:ribulose-5-phosphate 4-epimerase/fuculose-1-phosphate aldolase